MFSKEKIVIVVLIGLCGIPMHAYSQNHSFEGIWILNSGDQEFYPYFLLIDTVDSLSLVTLLFLDNPSDFSTYIAYENNGVLSYLDSRGEQNSISIDSMGLFRNRITGPGESAGNAYRRATREDLEELKNYGLRIPENFDSE